MAKEGDTLHLPTARKWRDMIAAGIKKEEYRAVKAHWSSRLLGDRTVDDPGEALRRGRKDFRRYRYVHLHDYRGGGETYRIRYIEIGFGRPDWGAPVGTPVYIIHIGERCN